MILPDKYLSLNDSLIGTSAHVLTNRQVNQSVSELWYTAKAARRSLTFPQFLDSLTLLYMLGLVQIESGLLVWTGT
jgi:hypothetical protein